MNVKLAMIKRGLLLSSSLLFLADASENTSIVQNPASAVSAAVPVAVSESNVLPVQSNPVQAVQQPEVIAPVKPASAPAQESSAKPVVNAPVNNTVTAVQPVVQSPEVAVVAESKAATPPVVTSPAVTPAIAAPVVASPAITTPQAAPAPTSAQPQTPPVPVTVQQPVVEAPAVPSVSKAAPVDAQKNDAITEMPPAEPVNDTESTPEESTPNNEPPIPAAPAVAESVTVESPVVAAPNKPVIPAGEGIDTLEQDGGNWLLKRQALEKTIDVIEKIKDVFTKTLEVRVNYLVKRNKTDRSFDIFANSIGFELGDLNQLLSTLVGQLKAERVQEGDLTEEERAVLQEIEDKIVELKGLKSTIKSITEMDALLDETLMQVEKEITTSNSYQTRAWRNFQTIKKVLSDEKAEELYLQTESLLKNMQEILKYLNGDLLNYFNGLIDTLKQNMSSAEEQMKSLETKGIDLQNEVKKIKKAEKLARNGKQQKNEDALKVEQEKTVEAKTPPKTVKKQDTWFDYVAVVWRYPIALATSLWDYGMSFFVTKKVAPKVAVQPSQAAEKLKVESKVQEQDVKNKIVSKNTKK